MSLALASRSTLRTGRFVRSMQSGPSPVGHPSYHHPIPFAWPHSSKFGFGLKLTAFLSLGFATPFLAGWYQLSKSGGA
ncbi:hypothetical protein D9758_001135 [Tetrapyrgos nigripes]|uniref:Cytochrome c oxidase subunit 8, mitochondrial n=1 Tax=Tetrapyrgos nigripes TaxID=182062 RepID=A0A8H5GRV4_9AGAR|nr:hypothetical protein D9758_001135 [Tetrapyrgos nigripes]